MTKARASRSVTSSFPDRYDPLATSSSTLVPLRTYTTKTYGPMAMARHKEEVEQRHATNVMSLGKSTRALLNELRSSSSATVDSTTIQDNGTPMDVVEDDDDGDVWVDVTNEGQQDDVVQMRDILAMHPRTYRPKDERTWALRIEHLDKNWRPLIPKLVDAFLHWQRGGEAHPTSSHVASDKDSAFTIDVLDFYSLHRTATIPMPPDCGTPVSCHIPQDT
ncbi:hypothetical protein ONZ51_g12439 [Trametes cubensis]|uniref:Uncharacterized protein n=1 Tax=Trametes cubensis TaxID=1111947 RepID=A0AAD7TFS8_9APHY|nr:hypothetical protein ONZ51_g12439 [Trametes cubensis]